MAQIEAIRPVTDLREIIQVNVPTRFFWNPDGTFDGIEFGPFEPGVQEWEEEMMNDCLLAIVPALGQSR